MLSISRFIKEKWQSIMIIMLYLVGFIGLISSYQGSFSKISVVQILICSSLVLCQYRSSRLFIRRFIALMIFGLAMEIIGTNTGFPFGDYYYGHNLGICIYKVPLIIALNWAIVIFCSKSLLKNFIKAEIGLSILTACLATSLDYFMEQTAQIFGFWVWENNAIPINNYIAWFIIAFLGSLILGNEADAKNEKAIVNIVSMYIFFFLLGIFI